MSNIIDQVIIIINDVLEDNNIINDNKITANTDLTVDLGLDSLCLAQLTVMIEDEFEIDIYEHGLISTVGDIIKQLKNNK